MVRKTRFIIRAAALALSFCVLSHLFGVFRPQQRQHVSFEVFSSSSSPLVLQKAKDFRNAEWHSRTDKTQEIRIVTTVCGGRTAESLAMIKSALIMSSTFIRFIVLADDTSTVFLIEAVRLWPDNILNRMSLDLRPIGFPGDGHDDWKKLFKLCSAERLFLPSLLKDEDSVLYMDIDTVFLSSSLHVWQHLGKMNETQMVALAPDEQDYANGWYPAAANHPYYGKFGVNAGVMLMNLTRMRHFGWEKYIVHVYEQYKNRIMWGDQDLINILFSFHPEMLYIYPCNYNYLAHHCSKTSLCKEAEQQGVYVLHGNTEAFLNDKQPALKAIYTSIQQHSFGDSLQMLLANMKENLMKTSTTNCGKVMNSLPKLLMDT